LATQPKVKLIASVNRSFEALQLLAETLFLKCLVFEIFRRLIIHPVYTE